MEMYVIELNIVINISTTKLNIKNLRPDLRNLEIKNIESNAVFKIQIFPSRAPRFRLAQAGLSTNVKFVHKNLGKK